MVSGGCTGDRVSFRNGGEAKAKLSRRERPPTGQSEETLWFRCWFRRRFQLPASEVPFSEVGFRGNDFRLAASRVPFSEVVDFSVLSYGSLSTRF